MHLDEALHQLGWNGRYHITMFVIFALITIRDPWPLLSLAFMGFETPHSCFVPDNLSLDQSIPSACADECACELDKCNVYLNDSTNVTVPCQNGWKYATDWVSEFHYAFDYETTIVMEWDLVCDRSYLVDLSMSMYMAGVLVGSLLCPLSDKLGRKKIFLFSLWLQAAVSIGNAFTTDFIQFAIIRFFIGAFNHVSVLVGFVYLVELYPASARTNPGIFVQIFWGVGVALLAPIGYVFKNWRYFQLVIALPAICFIPLYWFLPESVYWLANMGKWEEAERTLQRAAKMNGITLPKKCLTATEMNDGDALEHRKLLNAKAAGGVDKQSMDGAAADSDGARSNALQKHYTILDMFRTPAMRRYTLILFFIWFIDSLNYIALSLSTSELYGNKYVNFCIGGIIEIPACLMAAFLANKLGRRLPLLIFGLISGLATLGTVLVPESPPGDCSDTTFKWLSTAIALTGKFGITGSYAVLVLMTPEVFPTSIRNLGMGLCSVCDNIGGISAPLVNYAGRHLPWLPGSLLGTLAIAGGLGALFLPETHNQPLPQEVKDVEAWLTKETVFSKCRTQPNAKTQLH